jgi:chemotaxis protein methyltransferase WspC
MTRIARIDALLTESMGLDSASIGSSSIERAVRTRMMDLGAATLREYWQRLVASPDELQELIELVVVPETWFFRDREAFVELARMATGDWQPSSAGRVLRLLSLPSSTGEEPYSMAMALRDAGLTAESFAIDAVDISERALACAQHAIYGNNSFRGADLAFRDQHFEQTAHGYRVSDSIRKSVRFQRGNMHADNFLAGVAPYDAIFCRNLLIYFNDATQQHAAAVLERLLCPTGVLFVGPAETALFLNRGFAPVKTPRAFALRRSPQPAAPKAATPHAPARPRLLISRATAAKATPVRGARHAARLAADAHTAKRRQPASTATAIDRAFELADQGSLAEAAALCEAELREHGPSARAFYLLGLIYSTDGMLIAADRCYRKALYLDKNHHDALLHLAALLEQQGDTREAKVLRQRARRL